MPADEQSLPALSDRAAAVFLVQCLTVAEKDASLTDDQRSAAREDYARQAVALLRSVARDPKGVRDVRTAPEFEPLQNRDDFKKLVAEIVAPKGR